MRRDIAEKFVIYALGILLTISGFIAKKVWDNDARLAVIEYRIGIVHTASPDIHEATASR